MNKLLCLLLLFPLLSHSQTELIPRKKLFDTSDRKELFKLSEDGKWVFYIKDIYNYNSTLYYLDTSAPTLERSYSFEGAVADYTILKDFILVRLASPAGQKFVAFYPEASRVREIPLPSIQRARVYGTMDNSIAAILTGQEITSGLYRINAQSGAYELVRPGEGFINYVFDKHLNPVAGEKLNEQGGKSFYYLQNDEWILFREYQWDVGMTVRGVQNILSASADGRLVFFTDNKNSNLTNLVSIDRKTGNEEIIFDKAVSDIMPVGYITDENQTLLSVISHYGQSRQYPLNQTIKADFEFLQSRIKELHILDWSADHKLWLVESMNGGANEYFLYNRTEKTLNLLFNDHPFLSDYKKNHRYTFEIKSFDGTTLPINLYLREDLDSNGNGIPDSPIPAVIYVHGGPWIGWQNNNWLITRNLQLLANRGYVVVYAEFRGSATYGKEFVEKGRLGWGTDMMMDNVAIADWLADNNIALRKQIGIFGWSYGGYAAMAGLAFTDKYACGISMYGISDLDRFLRTDHANYPVWRNMVADIRNPEGQALAMKHSPLYSTDGIQEPLLLTTGGQDDRIASNQSKLIADSLKSKGINVGYLLYPDEGHDYRQKESWISFWEYGERFLNQYLGGDFEEITNEPEGNYEVVYQPEFHELQGVWQGPGEVTFSIINDNKSFKALVISAGELTAMIKTGEELFQITNNDDGLYSGTYLTFLENGSEVKNSCTMQIKGDQLHTSYGVIYTKIKR